MKQELIRAKKSLGQHFLRDENIALKIVASFIEKNPCSTVLEIGPGQGALTKYLVNENINLYAIEIDSRMIELLHQRFPQLKERIIQENFLKINLASVVSGEMGIIGNFPYNISSQILFKILKEKELIIYMVGMFQKEVARRIASKSSGKEYGILSVLTQAFYETEYLFDVDEKSFVPQPKVKSAVLRLTKKKMQPAIEDEDHFFRLVKTGFGKRRKMLRNSLKEELRDHNNKEISILDKRAEQLSVDEWINLSNMLVHSPVTRSS